MMIRYFPKPTVWMPITNLGIHALLGLVCFFMVLGSLLVPRNACAFRKGDKVMVQNQPGLNVRENAGLAFDIIVTVPNDAMGIIEDGPVSEDGVDWYKIDWEMPRYPTKWSAASWNGCQYLITPERAKQKDELAEALFRFVSHDQTNHDYNDFGCILKKDGKSVYEGGHAGWDVQTKEAVNHPERNTSFYSLTKGTVIRVGKIAHDFETGKNYEVLDLLPLEARDRLRATLENNKTIAVYNPINKKTTLYLHARQVFVSPGDDIFVGNCLGIQGATGLAFGVHVHIEVRDGEQPLVASGDSGADPPIPYLYKSIMENQIPAADVNRDGQVNLVDAKLVVENIGRNSPQFDINGDGTVNIPDLAEIVKYLRAHIRDLRSCAGAPSSSVYNQFENASIRASQISIGNVVVSQDMVQQWLDIARETDDGSLAFKQSIAILKSLLVTMVPQKTVLLTNYPNPFNPETWVPYYLAKDADVTVTIYDTAGRLVRQLDIGYQKAGYYMNRNRAVYWDGKSDTGERAANGVYFYTLTTDEYTATRKMVILK